MQTRFNVVSCLSKFTNILFGFNTLKVWVRQSILGTSVTPGLAWNKNKFPLEGKFTAKQIGFLFRSRRFFTLLQLLILYKVQIRPCLEYGSHLWRGAFKHSLATSYSSYSFQNVATILAILTLLHETLNNCVMFIEDQVIRYFTTTTTFSTLGEIRNELSD